MSDFANKLMDWNLPPSWKKITTIDTHTAGEPLRTITSGVPEIKGKTILDKCDYFQDNYDEIRKALMWEPRGHADMYGCMITPPVTNEADFGVIFMHNEGYSTMCGHGIIAITKVSIESGLVDMLEPKTRINIDSPAGLITATANIKNDKVQEVSFCNVPSFVDKLDCEVKVEEIGTIKCDIAFGGAYYAYVHAKDVGLTCYSKDLDQLIDIGRKIKQAISNTIKIKHPFDDTLSFLYGTIFIDEPENSNSHSRNVCIFADGEVDRSPTGTGVSGRLAIHHARNEIGVNESILIESIIGSNFSCRILEETKFGDFDAIIPEVTGIAHITGKHEFYIDTSSEKSNSFILR